MVNFGCDYFRAAVFKGGDFAPVPPFPQDIWQWLEILLMLMTCGGGGAGGIQWLAARDVAYYTKTHRTPPTTNYSVQNVGSAEVENSCLQVMHYISVSFVIFLYVGIKESDTGLAPPALWDLAADKQTLQSEQPLQVARYVQHSGKLFLFVLLSTFQDLGHTRQFIKIFYS